MRAKCPRCQGTKNIKKACGSRDLICDQCGHKDRKDKFKGK